MVIFKAHRSLRAHAVSLLVLGCALTTGLGAGNSISSFPLAVDESRSTTARQLAKSVLATRSLDSLDSTNTLSHFGPGAMAFSPRSHDGSGAVRLTSPTKTPKPGAVQGRPFAESGIRRGFEEEDWSAFNRLSVWVYPDLPGFKVVSLLLKLGSEGTAGRSYTDGGMHFVLLTNQQWNHVVWEIAHLDRRKVTSVDLIYRLQGNEPGAADRVQFDFDQLELQRVDPDAFEGWGVAPGLIALAHGGYAPKGAKVAIGPAGAAPEFSILDAKTRKPLWKGNTRVQQLGKEACSVFDFSDFRRKGSYVLKAGNAVSAQFAIGDYPLREALIAGLNFFYCERCGDPIPGVHNLCHQDWRVEHQGKTKVINGGWHDAGDLSQGLANTSEAVWSMLRLAERIGKTDRRLAKRLQEEALWGAAWLLKTRFGDGFRVNWATMDFWTDNQLGGPDDVTVRAGNSPFENFLASSAEAACARVVRQSNPSLANELTLAAEQDFRFASTSSREVGLELAAAGAQAAFELWHLTGKEEYQKEARRLATIIIASQQTELTSWEKPLRGFFYTSPKRDRILHYNHRSHEQAPIVALADICGAWPKDPQAAAWRSCVQLYGEYLSATARETGPYHMFAAGVYRTDSANPRDRQQIENGIRLAEGVYLRRFPIWGDFRGNLGVLLSQATAAVTAGKLLKSPELLRLGQEQIEWTLGRNPFAQSLMYGVGHNYAPQYTAMSGNLTGSLPVGIQTRLDRDIPYWPASNCYNYAEVWVHPVSRFFTTAAELVRE